MLNPQDFERLQPLFEKKHSWLLLLPSDPDLDTVAAGLSLFLVLQSQKKFVDIACPTPMRVEFGNLAGVEQVKTDIGNKSLRISFPYNEEMVEHVGYEEDKENKLFHLIIRPQKGHRSIDPSAMQYTHVGLDVEVIVGIGTHQFSQVEPFYTKEKQAFEDAQTICLTKNSTSFAEQTVDFSGYSSYSEAMTQFIGGLKLSMSSDIATNLFVGVEAATESFHHHAVTAETFESLAELLRAGARRRKTPVFTPQQQIPNLQTPAKEATSHFAQVLSQKKQSVPAETPAPGTLNYQPSVR